ncbi:hypothetical protein AAFF_G00180850 [Aldrovandia affinis]|uniref:Uncharacterized protein n=1 Tax=Aldrovandia affinis TaxID=143900 RepID=A0AAD7SYF0_9TELE|nr:hypothetical protein AAFF_G00180850 [Aldrovandia affinis]
MRPSMMDQLPHRGLQPKTFHATASAMLDQPPCPLPPAHVNDLATVVPQPAFVRRGRLSYNSATDDVALATTPGSCCRSRTGDYLP